MLSKRIIGPIVGLLFVASGMWFVSPAGAATEPGADKFHPATRGNAIADSYIVTLKDPTTAESTRNRLTAAHGGIVTHVYRLALTGFAVRTTAEQAKALAADSAVASVTQEAEGQIYNIQDNPPNWGLDRIDQRSRPLNSLYNPPASGEDVHAYILDTGLRFTHRDFGGRATVDADMTDPNGTGADCDGHGTHVAGTVGGRTFGVAKDVRIHAIKVLDCAGGPGPANTVAAIEWIIANGQRPAVVNMSFGWPSDSNSAPVSAAVARLMSAGFVAVAAAGNGNNDACGATPAGVAGVITVANATATDARRSDSSFGPCVDLFAPGDGIPSTSHLSDTGSRTLSGTSMSSPHVAGVAAQILERNPSLTPAQVAASVVQLHTTPNLITDPGPGTPNRMLFAGDDGFGSTFGDFNGDGRDDIATFTRSAGADVFVALSTGTAFGTRVRWHNTFAVSNTIPLVGDFNGDGRDDVATFTRGGAADVFVALSTGSSFGTAQQWHDTFAFAGEVPAVGDFNGDGRDDIVVFNRENVGDVFVALSNGSSFVGTGQRWHQDFAFIGDTPMVGDFNGDGRDDIAAFTRGPQADVFVALSGGASFGFRTLWHGFFSLGAEVPVVGDFNGDGRDDIACFTKDPGNDVFVATSNGTSFVGQGQVWHPSFGFNTEVAGGGDFTGDGRDDIIAFARGSAADVFVGRSTGTSFTGRVLWHDTFAANSEIPQPGSLW